MALIYFLRMDWHEAAAVAKFFASAFFVLTALTAKALKHRMGQAIAVGLSLSMIGDMLLLNSSENFFLLGLGSFLLAHVAYIIAFATHGQNLRWSVAAVIPIAALYRGRCVSNLSVGTALVLCRPAMFRFCGGECLRAGRNQEARPAILTDYCKVQHP